MDPPRRKRRDDLADQLGAPVYTGDPLPPYPSLVRDLLYVSARCNPQAAAALLPPGLTPVDPPTLTLAIYRHGPGWGICDTGVGFAAIAVNEHAAQDTSEAAFWVAAVMEGTSQTLAARHLGSFVPGGVEIRCDGDRIHGRAWSDATGCLFEMALRPTGPLQPQAANDRYIGIGPSGWMHRSVVSVSGPARPCAVDHFALSPQAPDALKRLEPIEPLFAINDPELVACWTQLEPIWPEDGAARTAVPGLLLELLDRQDRAMAILTPTGHLVEANRTARRLLAEVPSYCRDPLRPASTAEARRLAEDLARLPHRRGRPSRHFLLPRSDDLGPLVVEVMSVDPLPGAGALLLARITDPALSPMTIDATLLQLLGLTPAEARIAARVGAGLPPREAARALGLTESTVRSTLKGIFGKLRIGRQADLVALVARLGGG